MQIYLVKHFLDLISMTSSLPWKQPTLPHNRLRSRQVCQHHLMNPAIAVDINGGTRNSPVPGFTSESMVPRISRKPAWQTPEEEKEEQVL